MREQWIQCLRPRVNPSVRLFALPYAGGGASVYRLWSEYLPNDVEVSAIQLPGREERIREQPFEELEPLILALADALEGRLDRPFALFGHSFGAVVVFALTEHLRRTGKRLPGVLFLSGSPAPKLEARLTPMHQLNGEEFVRVLCERYGAIPQQLIEEPELLSLLLPTIRADIRIAERSHRLAAAAKAISVPIVALGGRGDRVVTEEELAAWKVRTAVEFTCHLFDGDHFYLNVPRQRAKLLAIIGSALEGLGRETGGIAGTTACAG